MTSTHPGPPRMPLAEHLDEARRRIIRIGVALTLAVIFAYLCSDQVLDVLRAPVEDIAESRNAAMNYDSITGAFDLKLKIAIFGGVILSSPVWLYQIFAYTAPALTRRERRYAFGSLTAVLPLFAAGCTIGVLIFPRIVELLTGFIPAEDATLLQASYYFDFVLKLVLAAGLAFTLPAFVVILNFIGVLPAKVIAKSWRGCVVFITVFSALVTPAADILSMFLIAISMGILFAVSLCIVWMHDRRKHRRLAAQRLPETSCAVDGADTSNQEGTVRNVRSDV